MIPQKDLSVLQFWNFVGQMTRDNGLYKIEAVCLWPNSKPNPESAAAARRDGTLILLLSGQHRFD